MCLGLKNLGNLCCSQNNSGMNCTVPPLLPNSITWWVRWSTVSCGWLVYHLACQHMHNKTPVKRRILLGVYKGRAESTKKNIISSIPLLTVPERRGPNGISYVDNGHGLQEKRSRKLARIWTRQDVQDQRRPKLTRGASPPIRRDE